MKNDKKRVRPFAWALPLGMVALVTMVIPTTADDEVLVAESGSVESLGAGKALSPATLQQQRGQGPSPSTVEGGGDGVAIILWDELKRPRIAHGPASSGSQSGVNSSLNVNTR